MAAASCFSALTRHAASSAFVGVQALLILHFLGSANASDDGGSTSSSSRTFSCDDLVVAGGGTGGLYSAWRFVQSGLVDPSKACIFEQTHRVGGRMRSVRGDELPEELSALGSEAIDVAAYRAWPGLHTLVTSIWTELGVESGCYHDIAFRTGDCTDECDPSRAIHKYLRDKYISYEDTLDPANVPYNLGPSNQFDTNSTYLSPYDWLYGAYAPAFWADNFADMALSEDSAVRWAARDVIVAASRNFEIDGVPSTMLTLEQLATTGYNSNGVSMTMEDLMFFEENDCNTAEHVLTRASFHDTLVEWANYFANGYGLGIGGSYEVPVDSDGKQIGYDIVPVMLAEKLQDMGVKLYYGHQVYSTRPSGKKDKHAVVRVTDLESGEKIRISTEHAVLNIPSEYIFEILGDGAIDKYGRDDLYDVIQSIEPLGLFKAYPFYEDSWWAKLGYTSGRMKTTLHVYNTRFHDGYSSCTDEDFMECSGVLLGAYVQGEKGERWAHQYFPERSPVESADGLHVVRRGQGPPEQDRFLDSLHSQNMASHKEALALIGIDVEDIPAPDLCLVGDYLGPTAGMHIRPTTTLPAGSIDEAAVEPFPGFNIHLVNEAYGIPPGWLQASLCCAERMLHHYYGLDKPPWLNDDVFEGFDSENYYKSVVGNSNGNMK